MLRVHHLLTLALLSPGCAEDPEGAPPSYTPVPHPCPVFALELDQELTGEDLATDIVVPPDTSPSYVGPGVAVLDYDRDGILDVAIASEVRDTFMLLGDGQGRLVATHGPWEPGGVLSAGDIDGDGYTDLYLGTSEFIADQIIWGSPGRRESHVPDSEGHTTGAALADLDGDGDLDVAVSRHTDSFDARDMSSGEIKGGGNHLFENVDGELERREGLLPQELEDATSFQVLALDADEDGRQDLYWVQDFGWWTHPNQLQQGEGGWDFSWPDDSGAELATATMGVAAGDINGDGHLDLWLSDAGSPDLLLSDGQGGFYEAALALGAHLPMEEDRISSWGTGIVDLDLDGRPELIAAYGPINFVDGDVEESGVYLPSGEQVLDPLEQRSALLHQQVDGTFVNRSDETALGDLGVSRSVVPVDLDNDGVPEVITTGWHDAMSPYLRVWRVSGGCGKGLTVRMAGGALDLGAVVEARIGERSIRRPLSMGSAFSSGPLETHLALLEDEVVDEVTVTWVDGSSRSWTALEAGLLVAEP